MIKSPQSNSGRSIVALFFLALLALGVLFHQDYGVSFDEPAQRLIGVTNLNHIAQIFNIHSILNNEVLAQFPKNLSQITDRDYGVVFELPAALMEHVFSLNQEREIYFARHLLTFIFFIGGVYAVYRIAERRFNDWRIGLLAATFLILSPRIFADAFYNSKDLVFLSVFAIAMNTTIAFVIRPNLKTTLMHALACAIAIDTRLMASLIPLVTIGVITIKALKQEFNIKEVAQYLIVFTGACIGFTILFWPFLWDAPLINFLQAFANMAKFRWAPNFLFRGELVNAATLPWYYLPIWIGISTPILYLGLFALGLIKTSLELLKNKVMLWKNHNQLQDLIFLSLFLGPILAIILLHSTLYNAWRHVFFVYPAFILIAVQGFTFLQSICKTRILKVILFGGLALSISSTLAWMIQNHPLQNIYFNSLAKNWDQRFEVDYWGLSNKQALDKILKASKEDHLKVWPGRGYQWPGGWQLPYVQNLKILSSEDLKRIETSESHKDADYVIASKQARQEHNIDAFKSKYQYELIDEVIVDNTPVLSIFKYNKDAQLPSLSAGDRVSFSQYNQGLEYLGSGWQAPEQWGSWSATNHSQLNFPLSKNRPQLAEIHVRALINKALPQQTIEIWTNGRLSKSFSLTKPFNNLMIFEIPKDGENLNLELKMPNAARPVDLGINGDERLIAIGLESIKFQ